MSVILAGFGSFWLVVGRFGWFWLVLAGFGWFWLVLAGFGSFWLVPRFSKYVLKKLCVSGFSFVY